MYKVLFFDVPSLTRRFLAFLAILIVAGSPLFFSLPKNAFGATYVGDTGIVFSDFSSVGLNPNGYKDLQMDCTGHTGSINWVNQTLNFTGGAHDCTSSVTGWWGQYNMLTGTAPWNTQAQNLPDGHYCVFLGGQSSEVCTQGEFDILEGVLTTVVAPNSISSFAPADNATNVDANINFSGRYSNDGTYTGIVVALQDTTTTSNPVRIIVCDIPVVGQNLLWSCNAIGVISNNYDYNVIMYESSLVTDTNLLHAGLKSFTTGRTLTVGTTVGSKVCETFDFACYIQNAFTWAFIPSDTSLMQFSSLTLENSIPFSYLYDIGTIFNELYANGGSSSYSVSADTGVLGTITFISPTLISNVPFASTIKTILGYILYFLTAMTLYRLLLRSHSSVH